MAGRIEAVTLISILFYTGIIPIVFKSIGFGKNVFLNNTYQIIVKEGEWFTGKEVNNLSLGIFQGILHFIISIIIWKIVCEILLIILRYFEGKYIMD